MSPLAYARIDVLIRVVSTENDGAILLTIIYSTYHRDMLSSNDFYLFEEYIYHDPEGVREREGTLR